MDHYHIWCNLKTGVNDVEFCEHVRRYLGRLQSEGQIIGFTLSRRKLGFGPRELGEFHIDIQIANLAQLDQAFEVVSARSGQLEQLHASVNQAASDVTFALYRDFPDPHRQVGQEAF